MFYRKLTIIFTLVSGFLIATGASANVAQEPAKESTAQSEAQSEAQPKAQGEAKEEAQAEPTQEEMAELGKKFEQANKDFNEGNYEPALVALNEICKRIPNEYRLQFLRGEVAFAAADMKTCVAAFDEVIRISPNSKPQLWQRGLALYYADRFKDGVEQFETHQTVNSQDVENAVWHLLCAAQISDLAEARKNLIPIQHDRRVPMAEVYEMFAGRKTAEEVLKVAGETSTIAPEGSRAHKLQSYYAHLYIGLYQEMTGEKEAALESMKKAIETNPLAKTNFMGVVAAVHLKVRGDEIE